MVELPSASTNHQQQNDESETKRDEPIKVVRALLTFLKLELGIMPHNFNIIEIADIPLSALQTRIPSVVFVREQLQQKFDSETILFKAVCSCSHSELRNLLREAIKIAFPEKWTNYTGDAEQQDKDLTQTIEDLNAIYEPHNPYYGECCIFRFETPSSFGTYRSSTFGPYRSSR